MRISCSFWYIVVSLLVLLASCDDSKKVDRLIEKEKQEARQREEEHKKREEEEKRQEEERKKKEEEERKKREEEEQKKKEEEKRKKKEEEEQKKKKEEEEAKFKVLEGVYSGKRTNGNDQIDEVFNVKIGYPEGDEKWNVTFSSVNIQKTAALITQEEDKLIFYVEWSIYYSHRDYSATLLFTPSSKKLKITTTCSDSSYNWTYEGTKQ